MESHELQTESFVDENWVSFRVMADRLSCECPFGWHRVRRDLTCTSVNKEGSIACTGVKTERHAARAA